MPLSQADLLAQVNIAQKALTILHTAIAAKVQPPQPPVLPPVVLPPVVPGVVPTSYLALTDRNTYPKPTLPVLGPAGFAFTDPTFGSRLLRVTDGLTRPTITNRSFRVPSSAHTSAWNADSTMFYVVSNDGSSHLFSFDPATMKAAKLHPLSSDSDLRTYVEPQFSLHDPKVLFGAGGPNGRTLLKFHLDTIGSETLLDLDALGITDLANTYVGGVLSGGNEKVLTFFGGGGMDAHHYVLLLDVATGSLNLIDTVVKWGFHLHAVQVDMSGRYVFMYPADADRKPGVEQVYIWDTITNVTTPITQAMHPAGHDATGYGVWINQDCCTACSWDAAQWQFRTLAAPSVTKDLVVPILTPKEVFLSDHTNWRNAQPDSLVPVISATYKYGANPSPWRAWDDEIIGIETANPGAPNKVWRFAHHRSNVGSDSNPAQSNFWYEPMVNVAPNGRWAIFTSNWEKSLGTDAAEGGSRQDVFLLELKATA